MPSKPKYRMNIVWSDEDQCYLVALPDFPGQQWYCHGDTYQAAAAEGELCIENLLSWIREEGKQPPEPQKAAIAA